MSSKSSKGSPSQEKSSGLRGYRSQERPQRNRFHNLYNHEHRLPTTLEFTRSGGEMRDGHGEQCSVTWLGLYLWRSKLLQTQAFDRTRRSQRRCMQDYEERYVSYRNAQSSQKHPRVNGRLCRRIVSRFSPHVKSPQLTSTHSQTHSGFRRCSPSRRTQPS
jgi:hypothetical protein